MVGPGNLSPGVVAQRAELSRRAGGAREQILEPPHLRFKGGLVLRRERSPISFVTREGVQQTLAPHQLVVKVRRKGVARIPAGGDHLSTGNATADVLGPRKLREMEEQRATMLTAGLGNLERISISTEVPILSGDRPIEGSLDGGADRRFEIHALVLSTVADQRCHLLVV